jgi:DNA-binding transcriptional LysR family regulator
MDVNWLRDLLEIEAQGSFSKAAKARNASVSSLSRRIQLLEEWAGRSLLDRSSHPVKLTAAGNKLLPVAQSVVQEIDRARQQLRGTEGQRDPVTFLVPNAVSVAIFPRLLSVLQGALGALPVSLVPDNFREVMRRFRDGDADFALYYLCEDYVPRLPLGNLESLLIAHDAMLPVARDREASLGTRPGVLRGVLLDEASYLGRIARDAMLRHHLPYEANVTGSQVLAIRQLAIEGAGLAWLPASLVAEDLAARRLQRLLPEVAPIAISVHVVRRPGPCSPTVEQVWRQITQLATDSQRLHFEQPLRQTGV